MSAQDNTKVVGLVWPDDRLGSFCSLTPLVRAPSADSASTISREVITSEVEVHLDGSGVFPASTEASQKGGLYKKNTNRGSAENYNRQKGPYDVFSIHSEINSANRGTKSANGCGTPPEYQPRVHLVRTWSNPTLYNERQPVFSTSETSSHVHKQFQGPCLDR